jgi:hypothetical protein
MKYNVDQLATVRPDHPHLSALRMAFASLGPITIADSIRRSGGASTYDAGAHYRRQTMQLSNSLFQNSMQRQHQSFLNQQEERRREDYRY